MAMYRIESDYLQFPLIMETESNDEAFEMFVAYCDYNGIDEDEIEAKHDDDGIYFAVAKQEDDEGNVASFTFDRVKKVTINLNDLN